MLLSLSCRKGNQGTERESNLVCQVTSRVARVTIEYFKNIETNDLVYKIIKNKNLLKHFEKH
jgi:hypothetical protein